MKRWVIGIGVIALLALGLGAWKMMRNNGEQSRWRTAKVERGELVQTVRATGTIQPIQVVEVGTQVTGPVKKLYVDFNSPVQAGEVVAQIDPATYEAQAAQGRANLKRARADVEQARARLKLSEKELERSEELLRRNLASQSELDRAVADRDALRAMLKLSQASVDQAQAALNLAEANLAYTTIRSPVDGVVIARNVNEGQTVVASFSSQTLFVIATDLRQMEVKASVPEADIGKIQSGQPVTFTVDAYPDLEFAGAVSEVRLAAETLQNVVTYPVIITAPNPDLKLLPTMTANLTVEAARREKVLKVPNAALRFKYEPPEAEGEAEAAPAPPLPERERRVWVPDGKAPLPVVLKTGITDGYFTEVLNGDLKEGQEVVIGILEPGEKTAEGSNNPFAPKFPGGRRRGGH